MTVIASAWLSTRQHQYEVAAAAVVVLLLLLLLLLLTMQKRKRADEWPPKPEKPQKVKGKGVEEVAQRLEERLGTTFERLQAEERRLDERQAALAAGEAELAQRAADLASREAALARLAAAQPVPEAPAPAAPAYAAPAAQPAGSGAEAPRGRWNVHALAQLVDRRGAEFPDRVEEWTSYLHSLRSYASADGSLPASFDTLIEETFGEIV